jgi:hypothetical protein
LIQAALLGGLFIGVLSALPIVQLGNCCCCLWVISGGMLAASLDRSPGRPNDLARGAVDGVLAGIVGAFVWLVAAMAIAAVMAPIQERLLGTVLDAPIDIPPNVRDWLESERGAPAALSYVVTFVMFVFGGMIFGGLGGLLGALFFWRDDLPPALGGPPPPPPPLPPL